MAPLCASEYTLKKIRTSVQHLTTMFIAALFHGIDSENNGVLFRCEKQNHVCRKINGT